MRPLAPLGPKNQASPDWGQGQGGRGTRETQLLRQRNRGGGRAASAGLHARGPGAAHRGVSPAGPSPRPRLPPTGGGLWGCVASSARLSRSGISFAGQVLASTCGRPPGVAPPRPLLPINEEGSASAPAPHPPASAWEEELASQAPFPPRSVHSAQLEGGSRRCLGNKAGGPESGLWTSWGSMGGLGCEPQGVGRVTCVFKRKRIQLRMFHRNLGPDVMPCVGFLGPQRRGVGGGILGQWAFVGGSEGKGGEFRGVGVSR